MKRLQQMKRWCVCLLVFLLVIGVGFQNQFVYAITNEIQVQEGEVEKLTGSSISVNTIENRTRSIEDSKNKDVKLTLNWSSPEEEGYLAYDQEGVCQLTPEGGFDGIKGRKVQCRLKLELSGEHSYESDEIKIHMPKSLFVSRAQSLIGTVTLGIPENGGKEGFGYYWEDDEVILYNVKRLEGANVFFCDMTYSYSQPQEIQNKYRKSFQGVVKFGVNQNIEVLSNILTVQVNTSVKIESITGEGYVVSDWNTAWGTPPSTMEDGTYVEWKYNVLLERDSTQPSKLSYEGKFQDDHGKVIAYYNQEKAEWISVENGGEQIQVDDTSVVTSYHSTRVVVCYPKIEGDHTFYSDVTVIATGIDDGIPIENYKRVWFEKSNLEFVYQDTTEIFSKIAKDKFWMETLKNTELNQWIPQEFTFETSGEIQRWDLTQKEGGSNNRYEDFGIYPYQIEMTDDMVFLDGNLLEDEEYQFTKCKIIQNEYDWNNQSKPESEWGMPVLEYQIGKAGQWNSYGGVEIHKEIILPKGVTGVKLLYQSKSYRNDLKLQVTTECKATERIKSYLDEKDEVTIYDVSTLRILDKNGNWVNDVDLLQNPSDFFNADSNQIIQEIYTQVKQRDESLYHQKYAKHRWASCQPIKITKQASLSVQTEKQPIDYMTRSITYTYSIHRSIQGEIITYLEKLGLKDTKLNETYYILLPRGIEPVNKMLTQYGDVQFVDNWRESGRTMVILVKQSDWQDDRIQFDAVYSENAYVDYGSRVKLNVAYECEELDFDNGYADIYTEPDDIFQKEEEDLEGSIEDKEWMSNLHSSTWDRTNMVYTKNVNKIEQWDTAGVFENRVFVKGEQNTVYEKEIEILSSGKYKYYIRPTASNRNYSIKQLVIYDILETAQPTASNRGTWKGEFVDIDVSYAKWLGINPVVYYAIADNIMINKDNIPDLTNGEIWTTNRPDDSSKIKGIAVDLSKKIDGTDFILEGNQAIPMYITMKVPQDSSAEGKIYNSAWFSGKAVLKTPQIRTMSANRSSEQDIVMEETDSAEVSIRLPRLWITKEDIDASEWSSDWNWDEQLRNVQSGSPINYAITIGNLEEQEVQDIVVEDEIPEGLKFAIDDIDLWEQDIQIKVDPTNSRKLIFHIKSIHGGGRAIVPIDIPTTVEYVKEEKVIENVASITSVGGRKMLQSSDAVRSKIHPIFRTISVFKEWNDEDNKEKKRPTEVIVKLLENGKETGKTVTLKEETGWSGSFEKVLKYDENGAEIQYSIEEEKVLHYTGEIMGDMNSDFFLINTYAPVETRIIEVIKKWNDEENKEKKRPTEVTMKLLENGKETKKTLVLKEETGWTGSCEEVAKYDETGTEIQYSVEEVTIPDYKAEVTGDMDTGFVVTNTYQVDPVPPVIDEETPSTSIPMIPIVPANPIIPVSPIIPSIPDGKEDNTKVEEQPEIVPTRTITVAKEWNDEQNKEKNRPEKVTIQLLKNGKQMEKELILSEKNGWKDSFVEVPKYEDGKEIAYSVEEVEVPNYKSVVTGTMEQGFVITNMYTKIPKQKMREISVRKEWKDENNKRKHRPEKVTIQLLADNKKVGKTLILSEENNWSGKFEELLQKDGFGKDIVYSIEELPVSHYTTKITGNMKDGFVVTNTDKETSMKPKEEIKPSIPTTSEPTTTEKDKPSLDLGWNKKKEEPILADSPRMTREVLKNIELYLQGNRGGKLGELELEWLKKQGIEVPNSSRMTREVLRQIELLLQGRRGGEMKAPILQLQQGLQGSSKTKVVKTYDLMKLGVYSICFVVAGTFIIWSIWKRKKKK